MDRLVCLPVVMAAWELWVDSQVLCCCHVPSLLRRSETHSNLSCDWTSINLKFPGVRNAPLSNLSSNNLEKFTLLAHLYPWKNPLSKTPHRKPLQIMNGINHLLVLGCRDTNILCLNLRGYESFLNKCLNMTWHPFELGGRGWFNFIERSLHRSPLRPYLAVCRCWQEQI